jgi:hypothetical protein
MDIKAIETIYKGYRFRSRLEARWAVFFDALGIEWVYEPEGYDLGEAGWYLPDFWFDFGTEGEWWIEVKAHKNLSDREYAAANAMSEHRPGFIVFGQPELPTVSGDIYLSPNDVPEKYYSSGGWHLPFHKFSDVGIENGITTVAADMAIKSRLFCWHEYLNGNVGTGQYKLWPVPAWELDCVSNPVECFDRLINGFITVEDLLEINPLLAGRKSIRSPNLVKAYTAARSARFEHGERNGKREKVTA